MLTSWVQQAAFEPPAVTIAVNKSRYLNEWLSQHPYLILNQVGQSQGALLSHFGKGFDPDANAFENLNIESGHHGIPRLNEAMGALECEVTNQHESGDHIIYTAIITNAHGGAILDTDKPMVHIRKNGFKY